MSDYEKQKHEEAYRKGVEAAKDAGLLEEVVHGLCDVATFWVPATTEHQSFEAGYHDQMQGKVK